MAVPRDSGKLKAAIVVNSFVQVRYQTDLPALIEAVNAAQLPAPVKKENKHMAATLYAPGPAWYALKIVSPQKGGVEPDASVP